MEEPRNALLIEMYDGQLKRLQAIVDEILEIEELSEVGLFFFCFPGMDLKIGHFFLM